MTYQLTPDYWSHYKRLQFIKKHTLKYQNPKVLDLACGTGILVSFPLAELGYGVDGVDIDPRSIITAKTEQDGQFPDTLAFILSDFRKFYPPKKYDVIVAGDIMEHLPQPEVLLQEIDRLLAPGGTAIISIPNGYGPHEMEEAIYHTFFEWWDFIYKIRFFNQSITAFKLKYLLRRPCEWPKYKPPLSKPEMTANLECGHAVHITEPWFRQMCENTGFDIIETQSATLLHGQITGHLMCNFWSTILFNTGVVDFLPSWMAAKWFFALQKK